MIAPARLILAAALLTAPQATAQAACGPHERVVAHLATRFAETRQALGLAARGTAMIEVFANLDTGSWTVLLTQPDGTACMIASGTAFEPLATNAPAGDPL